MPTTSRGGSSRKRNRRSRRTHGADQPILFSVSTITTNQGRGHLVNVSGGPNPEPPRADSRSVASSHDGSHGNETVRRLENLGDSVDPLNDDDICQNSFELRYEGQDDHERVEEPIVDVLIYDGDTIGGDDCTGTNPPIEVIEHDNEIDEGEDPVETVLPIQGYDGLLNAYDEDFSIFTNEVEKINFEDDAIVMSDPDDGATINNSRIDLSQCSETAIKVLKDMRRRMNEKTLLGAMTLYGQVRFTLKSYEHLAAVSKNPDGTKIVPCPTTMRQTILPYMIKNLFVRSDRVFLREEPSASQNHESTLASKYKRQVVIVQPSAWAAMDIADISVLRNIACVTKCNCYPTNDTSDIRIETVPAVRTSSAVSRRTRSLWVSKEGFPFETSTGTNVDFFFTTISAEEREQLSKLSCEFEPSVHRGEACLILKVIVQQTYSVELPICTSFDHIDFQASRQQFNLKLQRDVLKYLSDTVLTTQEAIESHCVDYVLYENFEPSSRRTKRRRQFLRTTPQVEVEGSHNEIHLVPGDLITFVDSPSFCADVIVAHISRFWKYAHSSMSNFMLFFWKGSDSELHVVRCKSFGVPQYVQSDSSSDQNSTNEAGNKCRTKGTLEDGRTYYVYRVLLYADDFNPRSILFPKGSVGGFYMSACSFSVKTRRSQSTIRTVSLTPPGMSTNIVFDYILDDVIEGMLKGFRCVDAFGNDVQVFLEVVGFVADYPASSAVLDLTNHNSLAPCTHCSFEFNKTGNGSKYSYITSINSCNCAFSRAFWRSISIRNIGIDKVVLKRFGMKPGPSSDVITKGKWPLLKLSYLLKQRQQITTSPMGFQYFDAYAKNIIAPDHLISGLMKGVLTVVFLSLTDEQKGSLQTCLRTAIMSFGYEGQQKFFSKKKLVGLSMSLLYAMFMCLPAALESLELFTSLQCRDLVFNLQSFSSLCFWWPDKRVDGEESWEYVHGKHQRDYHRDLHRLAYRFVRSVKKFHRTNPELSKLVDRPNTHRLIELTTHTIPIYSHALHISEMVFESSHQLLKFFLSRNTTANSHLYAVELILARDWFIRLTCLWKLYSQERIESSLKKTAMNNLLHLLCGKEFRKVNWSSADTKPVRQIMEEEVKKTMRDIIEERLLKWYGAFGGEYESGGRWVPSVLTKLKRNDVNDPLISRLKADLEAATGMNSHQFLFYSTVLFRRQSTSRCAAHEQLNVGDMIQILNKSSGNTTKFIYASEDHFDNLAFYAVGSLAVASNGSIWAAVRRCCDNVAQIPNFLKPGLVSATICDNFGLDSTCAFQVLKLDHRVRKVGFLHNCSSTTPCNDRCPTPLEGGSFYIFARNMGYPPRRS